MGRHFKIKVKAFRAIDNEELCLKYIKGHSAVLERRGFQHFPSNNHQWMHNPNVFVVIATSYHNPDLLYGGMRVEVKDKEFLPLERVLANKDIKVLQKVKDAAEYKTGEICGHWNKREVAGRGLSRVLAIAGIAILEQIQMKSVFAFNASYTSHLTRMMGFSQLMDVGNNGYFRYPTDKFRAYLWFKEDILDLSNMHEYEARRVGSLRKQLKQECLEEECSKGLMVHYDLEI